ncbi:MAG: transglycosylase domain-containing protein [Leptospirillia bacterium]
MTTPQAPSPPPPKKRRRPGRPGRRRTILVASISVLLVLLIGVAIGISLIDKMILARIDEIRNARTVPVFSSPLTLRTGEVIPIFRIWHYLVLSREGGTLPSSPTYKKAERTITLLTGPGAKTLIGWNDQGQIAFIRSRFKDLPDTNLEQITLPPLYLGSISEGHTVEYRPVPFDQISPSIKKTFLLSEDQRFFTSPAIDLRSIGRAFFHDIKAHRFKEGGSTITQQVVKILFLERRKTLTRKFEEAILSLRMAAILSPEEIFSLYLNHIDLGGYGTERIVGVEAASLLYFGRHANQIGWKEAATLAALVRAPTYYSPFLHPHRTLALRNRILRFLHDHKILHKKQWKSLTASPLGLIEPKGLFHPLGAYFLSEVAKRLASTPLPTLPGSVKTTMDPLLQEEADTLLSLFLSRYDRILPPKVRSLHPHDLQGVLIVMDPRTGEIRAMTGGRNFATSPLNRATRSKRQPASLFKIVPYLTALSPEENLPPPFTLASPLSNAPMHRILNHRKWVPKNDAYDPRATIILYRALARSMNLPALHMTESLPKDNLVDIAQKLGLNTPGPSRIPLSYPLGVITQTPLQMATAYSRIANGGLEVSPVLVSPSPGDPARPSPPRILPASSVYLLWSALQGVLSEGTGVNFLQNNPQRDRWAGKTGTANRGRDTWFVAISPSEVVLCWVGFDDNTPTMRFGSQLALPIVSALISWQNELPPPFPLPSDVIFADIDRKTGLLADSSCGPSLHLPFIQGTVPQESCTKTLPPSQENPITHFFRKFF